MAPTTSSQESSLPVNIFLWILQVLAALVFLSHARLLFMPDSAMARQMSYIGAMPAPLRVRAGAAEVLGAVGLVLPGLTRFLPVVTPLAASGLVIVMLGALVFHIQRREYPNLGLNAILLVLSAVIAYGRIALAPL